MMIKHWRTALGAVAAAVVMLGSGVAPVAAATSTANWTITPGGKFYTYVLYQTPYLTDTTTGARFPCSLGVFAISGTLKSGIGLTNPIGKIATAGESQGGLQCAANGLKLTLAFSSLPWLVQARRYDSASPGTTHGMVTGIAGQVGHFSGPACSAVIDGTALGAADGAVSFTYANNGTFTLTGAGNLHFYNVTGCGGQINNGDGITYAASMLIKANGSHDINAVTSP